MEWLWSSGLVTAVVTMAAIFVSGIGFYWRQVYDSKMFKEDIKAIKESLLSLNDVVVKLALQHQRLDNQAERISRTEALVDELRHGKGIVNKDVD
jgi:hypothetical protein